MKPMNPKSFRETSGLDAALRARLTACQPETRDLWPALALRLGETPRRPVRRMAVLLVAAAMLAALLMGAAVLRGFRFYDTATGESVTLQSGESYLPEDGDTGFSMTRLSDTDPNWRDQIHDDRDEWPETWDAQTWDYDENGNVVRSGTERLDFLNGAVFGQIAGEVSGNAGHASGSLYEAAWPTTDEAALRDLLADSGTTLWLPEARPARYTFAHGKAAPYVTPRQMDGLKAPVVKSGTDNGEDWVGAVWDLPDAVKEQINQVTLYYYGPDNQRMIFNSYLEDEAGHIITGSSEMKVEKLEIPGFEQAVLSVDTNDYYGVEETYLDLYEPIDPIRVKAAEALWPRLASTAPDNPMMERTRNWTDASSHTMRYRYYSVSLIGFSDAELNTLLDEIRTYGQSKQG